MSDLFWGALGLMLVIEGLLPFARPAAWREMFRRAVEMDDRQIRMLGLGSIGAGLLVLWIMG